MSQDKIQMPSGMGGLVRYFDEYHSKLVIKPGHIILIGILLMVIMILLYTFGSGWIGV